MEQYSAQIRLMGTVIDVKIVGKDAKRVVETTIEKLIHYEKMFSANDDISELMMINKQAGIAKVSLSSELYDLIKIGVHHSCEEDSFLNIAIGPLIKSWQIGFKEARVPNYNEIRQLLKQTNPKRILLEDETQSVHLLDKGMFIDLGALAKGYIADRMIDYFRCEHVESAILNLGGNVVVYGEASHHSDGQFRIGIQNPKELRSRCLATIKVQNQSVVTSGIYERVLKADGKTYHHIINPHTGYPIETDVASLTIISKKSVDGEIWTTRLFGKDSQSIVDEVNHLDDIECVVIDKDNQMSYSNNIKEKLI